MKTDDEDQCQATSWTLLGRIKDLDDQESWRKFYELYRGLLLRVAIKSGLRDDEAEDVVQATMVSVSKNIRDFEADPKRGRFTPWLLRMAYWRIEDQRRKRLPVTPRSPSAAEGTATTSTIERVPDPREPEWESLCAAEQKRWLLEALEKEVKAEHYQIFHLLTVEQKTIGEVARMVGRNRAQIYLVKHRVTQALKRVAKRLEARLE